MALAKNLSELPKAAPQNGGPGMAPDAEPRFVQLLVEQWRQDDIDHPHVRGSDARFWHSDAGKCARLISYKAAGIPASDPMDLSGINNVRIGQTLHDEWQQAAIKALGPNAEAEVRVFTLDGDGTGRIDLLVRTQRPVAAEDEKTPTSEEWVISLELKTIGGFGYKASIGKASKSRPAEGPKSEHLLQAALNGLASEAHEIVIAYLAKEAVSVNAAGGISELTRFAAEWSFTREQFVPLAERELERVAGILNLVDEGTLAARKIPDLPPSSEITDPKTGRWQQHGADGLVLDTGSYWGCAYCSHQTLCAQTDAGRVSVESVVEISAKAVA